MSYTDLMYLHLATIIPAFFIGTLLILIKKGAPFHKGAGRVYMSLMLATACVTLLMEARAGIRFLNHFGFIHLFSFLVIYSVPRAYFAIKRGDVKTHKRSMIGLYIGGIIIAGGLTFAPGRYMHQLFFG
tara:strand:+ start:25444 stop:25830 length:387 start_codon:yes stop_codon:yes gene_type:complete